MKYIHKTNPPEIFKAWCDENKERLLQTCETGDEIWSKLKGDAKKDLTSQLLDEQGHICAYCGVRIGKGDENTFCVEHFVSKGLNKNQTLEYNNLLGCCKMSQKTGKVQTIEFPVPDHPHLKTLQDIADYLAVTIENLQKNNRPLKKLNAKRDLELENSKKTSEHIIKKIDYEANIHHCDDTKARSSEIIINPVKEDCERGFTYKEGKNSKREPICEIIPKKITEYEWENTIRILNLNADNLCKERVSAYKAGQNYVDLLLNSIDIDIEAIEAILKNDVYATTDNKLEPFCFVTASIIRDSFFAMD
jgi:hypothetical protein